MNQQEIAKTIDEKYEAIIRFLQQERAMVIKAFEDAANFDYIKVHEEYANAIGITMDELTTQQKQQAVISAVLKEQ